jgi:hypothetical protein
VGVIAYSLTHRRIWLVNLSFSIYYYFFKIFVLLLLSAMPYNNWGDTTQRMSDQRWANVRKLSAAIITAERNGFSTVEGRRAATEALIQAIEVAPFAYDLQFPEYQSWLFLDGGDWPAKMTQALSALDHKETSKPQQSQQGSQSDKTKGREQLPDNDIRGFYSYDDALHAFHQAMRRMKGQLGAGDQVYTRGSFARDLGLTWA